MTGIVSLFFVWIITEVLCEETVFPRHFRCNNGKYIDNRWFCDDDLKDCGDLSDESFGCDKHSCGSGNFQCRSDGPCIDITGRCNTINDCPDGSDELNCGDETDIENCTLSKGKYLCQDKMKCLDFHTYVCDGVCNCLDCSDETDRCKQFDSHSCGECPHYCVPTPNGPQCACNSRDYESSKLCREIENCTGSSACSQRCSRYKNMTRCSCYDNHHEIHDIDGVKCRSNVWLQIVLLYSTATKIKALRITTTHNQTESQMSEIIQNEVNCTVLTAGKDFLYYATNRNNKKRIFKAVIGTKKTEEVIELDSSINSLAVDWITNNLYFTTDDKNLSVCSSDGRICIQLKCCVVNYVTLAPKFGWMFYTHNIAVENEQLIMKSNMDGSEEQALLDMSFHSTMSLAADEWTKTIYWFEDETQVMHATSFNGYNKREIALLKWHFSSHFSILERLSFFVKNHSNEIYTAENPYLNNFTIRTDKDTNNIRHLYAYNPFLQLTHEIRNPCTTSSCNGLCLLRSTSYTNGSNHGLNYTCMCANFTPGNNNHWCNNHPARSVSQFKSSTKREVQIDSSTKPSSTYTSRNNAFTSTKASTIFTVFSTSSSLESSSCNRNDYTVTIFNIMSCAAFALSISAFFLIIRNKNRQKISLCEQIEM